MKLASGEKMKLPRLHGGVVALVVLLIFNALFTPNFLQLQTLFVNISQVATIAIVAMGMTLVIATGGIDLSVGAVMALAGALAPLIFLSDFGVANPTLGIALAIALPLIVAGFCGVFNGIMVAVLNVQPIIATLILFISGRGIAQVLTNGNLQTFSNPSFSYLGTGRILGLPFQGWLALASTSGLPLPQITLSPLPLGQLGVWGPSLVVTLLVSICVGISRRPTGGLICYPLTPLMKRRSVGEVRTTELPANHGNVATVGWFTQQQCPDG